MDGTFTISHGGYQGNERPCRTRVSKGRASLFESSERLEDRRAAIYGDACFGISDIPMCIAEILIGCKVRCRRDRT